MDTLSPERRSEIMKRIGSKNTLPEMRVRRLLHRIGCRFRLHAKRLSGKPDIVLPRWKTVIFVHGCFWHGCTKCDKGLRRPKANAEFWQAKLQENRQRDQRAREELQLAGWRVLILWQCETSNLAELEQRLRRLFPREGATAQ